MTRGTLRVWSRETDAGHVLDCAFCPACGRVWHRRRGAQVLSVKAGSLDEPMDLREAVHIWTSRMLPGMELPQGVERHEGAPPPA